MSEQMREDQQEIGPVVAPVRSARAEDRGLPATLFKADEETAYEALRRSDDQQFVVHRRWIGGITEEVAESHEHFPFRAREGHGERLIHLDAEPDVEARAVWRAGDPTNRLFIL